MHNNNFKPFWKTCEFASIIIYLVAIHLVFTLGDPWLVKISTGIVCAYIVARALFKKNRAGIILDGQKTSEFYLFLAWTIWISILMWKFGLYLRTGFECIGVTVVAFVLARGYTKGHSSVKATVVSL